MNIRGLGDAPKVHYLRDLLQSVNPFIFFAQETMCDRERAINSFLSIKKGWNAAAVGAVGQSGGLIAIWDPVLAS